MGADGRRKCAACHGGDLSGGGGGVGGEPRAGAGGGIGFLPLSSLPSLRGRRAVVSSRKEAGGVGDGNWNFRRGRARVL